MRILIVEDQPDTAQSLAILLGGSGHDVQIAADGPSALAAAQAAPPDVVLLDIGLPGTMDGWDVVRRLRQIPFPRRPQIIAVTGYDGEMDRKRSYETGVDFHFTKPADPEVLGRVLEHLERLCLVVPPLLLSNDTTSKPHPAQPDGAALP
jgi:two-component system, OmpR family, response regulator